MGLGLRSLSRQSAFFGQLRSLLEQETAWIDSPVHTGVCARAGERVRGREGGRVRSWEERGWEGERVGGREGGRERGWEGERVGGKEGGTERGVESYRAHVRAER